MYLCELVDASLLAPRIFIDVADIEGDCSSDNGTLCPFQSGEISFAGGTDVAQNHSCNGGRYRVNI